MNAELQAQLAQIIAQIAVSVGQGKDFALGQLPEIAQQYVAYGVWSNAAGALLSLVIAVGFMWAATGLFEGAGGQEYGEEREGMEVLGCLLGVVSIVPLAVMVVKINALVLVMTAPKVWLILELKGLLKG